ncbi:MAG TPA: hypothetical protein VF053_03285 [Streptosporangiales bacterium]
MSIRRGRRRSSTGNGWQRLRRWAGLDGNPLRRPSDRLQAWVRLGGLAFAIAGLVVTGIAARGTYTENVVLEHANAAAGYRVTGHVISATNPDVSPDGTILRGMVRVSWRDRAGRPHAQLLVAPTGLHAPKATMPLWIDARGRPSTSPPNAGQPATAAAMTGVLGAGLTVTTAALLYLLAMVPIERRRLAEWQREWTVVEPGWRRQVL